MIKTKIIKIIIIALLSVPDVCFAQSNFRSILINADKARGNYEGIRWKVNITTGQKYKQLYLRALGFDLLAETLLPAKFKGNKLLMVSGNMWFYKPRLSKPIAISRRQKLLGDAAYGDISSTNYADDYKIESVNSETIDDKDYLLFDLVSISKQNTYDRIHYWVDKDRQVGVKADYFTVSGKLIKSATMLYQNTIIIDKQEQLFISKITIADEIQTDAVTVLEFNEPELKKIPEYYFNVNFLRK